MCACMHVCACVRVCVRVSESCVCVVGAALCVGTNNNRVGGLLL